MVQAVGHEFEQTIGRAEQNQRNDGNDEHVGPAALVDQLLLLAGMQVAAKIEDNEITGAEKVEHLVDIDKKVIAVFLVHFRSFRGPFV